MSLHAATVLKHSQNISGLFQPFLFNFASRVRASEMYCMRIRRLVSMLGLLVVAVMWALSQCYKTGELC